MIDNKKLQISFFFILFALVAFLVFQIFRPFFGVIFSAAVFAVILQPVFSKMLFISRKNHEIAATLSILSVAVFIAIPVYFLGVQIVNESTGLYSSIMTGNAGNAFSELSFTIDKNVNLIFPTLSFNTQAYLGSFLGTIAQNAGAFVSGTAFALIELFFTVLALFFFLKDGPMFIRGFVELSPLEDEYDREILDTLHSTIRSVLRGALAVAIIQGLVLMTGFAIFKVPNAFLWGTLAMVSAVVPGIGTAVVFIPGILYLFYTSQTAAALGLLVWSFFLHGTVDNFLAPILYGKGLEVHKIFIMFSVLGGLAFFGPLGFLFGPVVFSVFTALFRIYRLITSRANA